MRINTNAMAMNAGRNLAATNSAIGKSLERLSTGLRINRAADDAAGLVVANSLSRDVKALNIAIRNIDDNIGVLESASGALNSIVAMITRVRELATLSSNGGTNANLASNESEANALLAEIDRIANTTTFNGVSLIKLTATPTNVITGFGGAVLGTAATSAASGSTLKIAYTAVGAATITSGGTTFTGADYSINGTTSAVTFATTAATTAAGIAAFVFTPTSAAANGNTSIITFSGSASTIVTQVGIGVTSNDSISYSVTDNTTSTLAITAASIDLSTTSGASSAMTALDTALSTVNSNLAALGVVQNRLGFAKDTVTVLAESLGVSESRIRDVDISEEMTHSTKLQILQQAGIAALEQANTAPQSILKLLG